MGANSTQLSFTNQQRPSIYSLRICMFFFLNMYELKYTTTIQVILDEYLLYNVCSYYA